MTKFLPWRMKIPLLNTNFNLKNIQIEYLAVRDFWVCFCWFYLLKQNSLRGEIFNNLARSEGRNSQLNQPSQQQALPKAPDTCKGSRGRVVTWQGTCSVCHPCHRGLPGSPVCPAAARCPRPGSTARAPRDSQRQQYHLVATGTRLLCRKAAAHTKFEEYYGENGVSCKCCLSYLSKHLLSISSIHRSVCR